MTDLGFTNKELSDSSYYGSPCCPSGDKDKGDWEKQIAYPEIRFSGKVAEALGADDLDLGETVDVTVRLRVKELRDEGRMVDGKKKRDVSLCFEVLAASDMTPAGEEAEEEDEKPDEDEATDSSPVNAIL